MKTTVTTERPADMVAEYSAIAWQWWADGVEPHGEICPCLPCSDLRVWLGERQPRPPTIATLIERGVTWLPDQPCGCKP